MDIFTSAQTYFTRYPFNIHCVFSDISCYCCNTLYYTWYNLFYIIQFAHYTTLFPNTSCSFTILDHSGLTTKTFFFPNISCIQRPLGFLHTACSCWFDGQVKQIKGYTSFNYPRTKDAESSSFESFSLPLYSGPIVLYAGGLNHLPYLQSIAVSMAVMGRFFDK